MVSFFYCRVLVCSLPVILFLFLSLHAAEPEASRMVTIEECLSRVTERSLEFKAGAYKIEAAFSRAKQAARLLNPRLETEIENFAGSDDIKGFQSAESTVSLVQTFELGNKRRHRTTAAEAEMAFSQADETARRSALLFDTRRAILVVLTAQAKVRLATEMLSLIRETEGIVATREQAGKATVMETERARIETARAIIIVKKWQAEQQDAVRELALCWGETEPTFDAVAGALDVQTTALPPLDTLLLQMASNPALIAADAQSRIFEAKVRIEKAARLPNLDLAAGMRRFEEPEGFGFVAGVGIELPIFNRNREAVRAAEADAKAVQMETAAVRLKTEGLLRRLYARLKALAIKEASLRDTVVPASERTLAFVKQAHVQGKAGYLDVIEARRTLAETQFDVIDVATEYHVCRIELERLSANQTRNP